MTNPANEPLGPHSVLVFGADPTKMDETMRRDPRLLYMGPGDINRISQTPTARKVYYSRGGLGGQKVREVQEALSRMRESGTTLVGVEVTHQGLLEESLRRELSLTQTTAGSGIATGNGAPAAVQSPPIQAQPPAPPPPPPPPHEPPSQPVAKLVANTSGRSKTQIIFDGMIQGLDDDGLFGLLKAEYPGAERKELCQIKYQVKHSSIRGRGKFGDQAGNPKEVLPEKSKGEVATAPKATIDGDSLSDVLVKLRDSLASALGLLDVAIEKSRKQEAAIEAVRPLGALVQGLADKLKGL